MPADLTLLHLRRTLAQTDDPDLSRRAEAAAAFLGLAYARRRTGYGELVPSLTRFVGEPVGR